VSKPKPAKLSKPASPAPPIPEPAWKKRAAALGAHPLTYLLVSLALLAPCYWHSRIQAGDLASHIYNVWLAQLVARGQAPGLAVVPQTTNILFDLILSGLYSLFGAAVAQRLAVSLAVVVFAWGAFAFVSTVTGRRAWSILPALAMLAYGWVFHAGFFNFYLSLGLCLGAMALGWDAAPRRLAAAVPILALAYVAHALPVAWALGLMGYRAVALRLAPERRFRLAAAAVVAMVMARAALGSLTEIRGSPAQITLITGADQLWVFNQKYLWVATALLALWALLLATLIRRDGARGVLASVPFHFCLLSAAAIAIFPSWLLIPGYKHALVYIAERLSLPLAVCICALAAGARPRPWQVAAMVLAMFVFFGMLFRDEGVLNDFEDRLERLAAQLPPGQRLLNGVDDPFLRADTVGHMIDRICIGRCYSYANYEPSTAQFRVRVLGANPIVAATYADSYAMQTGKYVVKPTDLPLYGVFLRPEGTLDIRSLPAGAPSGITAVDLL